MLSLAGLVVALALGVPLGMYFVQDRLIFFPQPLAESRRAEVTRRFPQATEVFLGDQHAWYVPGGDKLVLYFGGNAEEVSWMVGEALERTPGVAWLLVDYRGYGASAGSPSEAALVADALAWYDHIVNRSGAKQVYVFGRSLGSAVAVRVAAERPVAGVIVVAPFDSLAEVAKRYYPFLPVRLMLRHRFDSAALAPRIQAPLLCLVATADEIIPAEHSRRLYEAWAGPKRWIALQGAGHNSTDGAPLFWQNIRGFIFGR